MQIVMSPNEASLFKSLVERAGSYFEYGVGGSTFLASQFVKGRIVAVDTDANWIDKMREAIPHSAYERSLIYADIGPTGDWGYPLDTSVDRKYKNYYSSISSYSPLDFDMCLVDGRFRVACFLSCLKYTNSNTIVCIHDYRCREAYHCVEQFARPIFEVENLTVFVKRSNVDLSKLENEIEKFSTEPS